MKGRDIASDYLTTLWGAREGYACLAFGIDPHWTDTRYTHRTFVGNSHHYQWPSERDQLIGDVADKVYAGNTDVYVNPALRAKPDRKKGTGCWSRFLWADIDSGGDTLGETISELWTPGSFHVRSGGDQCHNMHLYLAVGDWLDEPELEELNRLLRDRLGSDHKFSSEVVLRLPGTYSLKDAARGGNRRFIPWVPPNQQPDGTQRAELRRRLVPQQSMNGDHGQEQRADDPGHDRADDHQQQDDGNFKDEALPPHTLKLLNEAIDRSAQTWRLVEALCQHGLSDDKIRKLAARHTPTKQKYAGRIDAEVDRILAKLREKQPASEAPTIELLTIAELDELKPPTWRIESILPDASFATIFGVQSTYKSFVALDWSLSIAAGIPWLGYAAVQGVAVYVAAEGGTGLAKRIRAWRATRDHDPAKLTVKFRAVPRIVNLRDPASVDQLHKALVNQLDAAPDLLVVDTWSRSMPGGNENAAEEVSAAIDRLDRIRDDLDCGMLIVHHAGIETGRERGSSSLPYAMDCRWETDGKPNAETIDLRNHKQKDWETTSPIRLRRHVVADSDDSSLILRLDADPCSRHRPVVAALDGAGALVQNKLVMLLVGTKSDRVKAAQDAAACERCPVESWGAGRSIMYRRTDQTLQ